MTTPTSSNAQPASREASPVLSAEETAVLLRRIASAFESSGRHRWMEITSAIVLSLATTASAWCAYQATRWGGVQTFRLDAANDAAREAAASTFSAMQLRAFDVSMLTSYLESQTLGNSKMENMLYRRFRPEAKAAIEAWLKTDPLNDLDAPLSPFVMPEYVQPELLNAARQSGIAKQNNSAAQEASKHSDTYVLMTVLFASVLFFGGIGGTFDSYHVRVVVLGAALLLCAGTLIAMAVMPICSV